MSNNKSVHILHSTKRRFVSSDEITATGNNDTFIGALPPNIITKIPFDSRGTITKQTDNIFSNFASAVSHLSVFKYVPYSFNSGYFEKYCSQAVQELNAVFNTTDTDISYIGSGEYKHCFMINFEQDSKNSYVLQAFHNIMYCDLYHGVKFEPLLSKYAK